MDPETKGLLSFAFGGALLLVTLYDIILEGGKYWLFNMLLPRFMILGFLGFLLLGYGLMFIIRETLLNT